MKDNDVQAAVKSQFAPTLGADSGPIQTAKHADAKVKAPAPQNKPGAASNAGQIKVVPVAIPPGAPTKVRSKSKQTKIIPVANSMPKTEKTKPEAKAVKSAPVGASEVKVKKAKPEAKAVKSAEVEATKAEVR